MRRWAAVAWVGAMITACGGGDVTPGAGVDSGVAGAEQGGAYSVRPPGGLVDWLSDIEAGLPSMADVQDAWIPAQRGLVELYVARQEVIEQYWGPSGRLQGVGGERLGEGVLELESAFHRLLQFIMEQPLDTVKIRSAVDEVRAQVAAVRILAVESGLTLIPPPDSMTAGE